VNPIPPRVHSTPACHHPRARRTPVVPLAAIAIAIARYRRSDAIAAIDDSRRRDDDDDAMRARMRAH
jgi:hypothetical protein